MPFMSPAFAFELRISDICPLTVVVVDAVPALRTFSMSFLDCQSHTQGFSCETTEVVV
jgi:hypothetical protein